MAGKVQIIDKGYNRMMRAWRKLALKSKLKGGGPHVTVGIQASDGGDDEDHPGITNLELATIHEFGAPAANIPSRSFVRSTVDKNQKKYQRILNKAGKTVLKGQSPKPTLFQLGEVARGDMIRRIQQADIKQDLAASTKRQRGEDGPALLDTGQLINAISSVVHD
jgi:phage gpG-like protein